MQNDTAASTEHAPINWVTSILFTLTPLAAIVFVPWYGLAHGFSAAAWLSFIFFLWACGISITAGYHRLWSHRTYQAHWSVRLFFMLFGAMALQNSILIWSSQHRTHHRFVDDVDKEAGRKSAPSRKSVRTRHPAPCCRAHPHQPRGPRRPR